MQRIKEEGQDPSIPIFRHSTSLQDLPVPVKVNGSSPSPVPMTNPAVKRIITLEELHAHNTKERPWFVIDGEVGFVFGFFPMANFTWLPRSTMGPTSLDSTLEERIRLFSLLGKMPPRTLLQSIVQMRRSSSSISTSELLLRSLQVTRLIRKKTRLANTSWTRNGRKQC
jgi:hypothetical protein